MNVKDGKILILGGAGFIGSNLTRLFVEKGWNVTVIDGLLEATGGDLSNIEDILPDVTFLRTRVEDCRELGLIIENSDIIIDCMAWTTHRTALSFPEYDLDLNCRSHLNFINVLKEYPRSNVIYLGSRVQYGNPDVDIIREDTHMVPEDIQGIHKLAAETYYMIYSKMYNFNTVSLRIPGCFGVNQPYKGKDIGLVGNFIRSSLNNEEVVVFGERRKRSLLFVTELEDIVYKLILTDFKEFSAFNISGVHIYISELAKLINKISGNTREVIIRKLSKDFIDIGNTPVDDSNLRNLIGNWKKVDIEQALSETVNYYRMRIGK